MKNPTTFTMWPIWYFQKFKKWKLDKYPWSKRMFRESIYLVLCHIYPSGNLIFSQRRFIVQVWFSSVLLQTWKFRKRKFTTFCSPLFLTMYLLFFWIIFWEDFDTTHNVTDSSAPTLIPTSNPSGKQNYLQNYTSESNLIQFDLRHGSFFKNFPKILFGIFAFPQLFLKIWITYLCF